jgi:hypothetical protein
VEEILEDLGGAMRRMRQEQEDSRQSRGH